MSNGCPICGWKYVGRVYTVRDAELEDVVIDVKHVCVHEGIAYIHAVEPAGHERAVERVDIPSDEQVVESPEESREKTREMLGIPEEQMSEIEETVDNYYNEDSE
jgi:hypothetical protein